MHSRAYKISEFQRGELVLIPVGASRGLRYTHVNRDILVRVPGKLSERGAIWQMDNDQIKAEVMQVNICVASKLL